MKHLLLYLLVGLMIGCGEKKDHSYRDAGIPIRQFQDNGVEISDTTSLYQILINPNHFCDTIDWKRKYDSIFKNYYILDKQTGEILNAKPTILYGGTIDITAEDSIYIRPLPGKLNIDTLKSQP